MTSTHSTSIGGLVVQTPLLLFVFFLQINCCVGQSPTKVTGFVKDELNKPVALANIWSKELNRGVVSDEFGYFEFQVPPNQEITLRVSHSAFENREITVLLSPGEKKQIEVNLPIISFGEFVVEDERTRNSTLVKIPPKLAAYVPSVSGGIESLLAGQAGVSMTNELSSAYRVRGGNFDENLVYVNDIEVYRPFLVRSGEQEGLSFPNPDMVSSISFSAGGFESRFGDKLSSVLDIKYKKPIKFGGAFSASLLGGSIEIEDASENLRLTHISGIRYRTNQYVLNSLETQGDYRPSFTDFQTYWTYDLTEKIELEFLGNYGQNQYNFVPETRETELGNITEALRLTVFFDGQEVSSYETFFGAIGTNYKLNATTRLKFTASAFRTFEEETFDVRGQYLLDELDRDLGSDDFGDVLRNRGIGTYINHARNDLEASVFSFAHKGWMEREQGLLEWGIKLQMEEIEDVLSEWRLIDSAGFSLPQKPSNEIVLDQLLKADLGVSSQRITGYLQHTWDHFLNSEILSLNMGVRAHYWSLNGQTVVSPRATLALRPKWFSSEDDSTGRQKNIVLRFSTGYYYQPPFYRELRDLQGVLNKDLKAQRSIHFVLGADYLFQAWERPFKFVTEAYYKDLNQLIPYEVDNVRIRYYANNNSKGYATGVDFKVNGEFVKGIESWVSLSLLRAFEDIQDDFFYNRFNQAGELIVPGFTFDQVAVDSVLVEPGEIPRPSDQRVNFSMFFQDEMPKWPSYKVHLRLIYGTGLPFGPPTFERYKDTLRTPSYRRVDVGFSKEIIGKSVKKKKENFFSHFNQMWLTLEVFNLMQINNTVSYLWIKDVNNRLYAVPNFLTTRRLNLKLVARF